MAFKRGMTVDLCMTYAHAHFDDLDARSQWAGKGKIFSVKCSRQLNKQQALNLLQVQR